MENLLLVLMRYAPTMDPKQLTAMARFATKVRVDPQTACWLWTGSQTNGYGMLSYQGVPQLAHRLSWQWLVGPIPPKLHIDHLCRVTTCVNPAHLEPVTGAENVLRGHGPSGRLRTSLIVACPQGHPYSPENTYYDPKGGRRCKECNRQRARISNARRRHKPS